MTTTPAPSDQQPTASDAADYSPGYEAALARFADTREHMATNDHSLDGVLGTLDAYDRAHGLFRDDPEMPNETDFFNPEADLVPQMFDVEVPFVLSAPVIEPPEYDEFEFEPEAEAETPPAAKRPRPSFVARAREALRADKPQASDVQPIDAQPDVHDTSLFDDTSLAATEVSSVEPQEDLGQIPAPVFVPVFVPVAPDDSGDAVTFDSIEPPQFLPPDLPRVPTPLVPSLPDVEREHAVDIPELADFPNAGPTEPSRFEQSLMAAPTLMPPPLDLGAPDDTDYGPRPRSVAALLNDEPFDEDDDLYNETADQPLEEATVAVDAKKSRFARSPKKVKTAKAPKEPKFKTAKAPKERKAKGASAPAADDGGDEPEPARTSASKRNRLLLAVSAVVLTMLFALCAGLVGAKALGYEPSNVNTNATAPTMPVTALVMSKQAKVSSLSKGDPVVVTQPDGSQVYGFYFSADADAVRSIKIYDNVNLKPRGVPVKTVATPTITIPSVGTEVTTALGTPVPAALAVLFALGAGASVVIRRKK